MNPQSMQTAICIYILLPGEFQHATPQKSVFLRVQTPKEGCSPGGLSLTGIIVTFYYPLSTDDKGKLIEHNFQAFIVKVPSVARELLSGLEWCQLCVESGQ